MRRYLFHNSGSTVLLDEVLGCVASAIGLGVLRTLWVCQYLAAVIALAGAALYVNGKSKSACQDWFWCS